ncbi:hypothetical protein LOZ65_001088 [Ophidiomyces ophidiicola]|nr:hypothetical protein LOZ65_001088 [Ophidiomyces ophidiicola]
MVLALITLMMIKIDAMSRDLRRILHSIRQVGADSKRKDAEQVADKFREAADTFSQVAAEITNAHEGSSDVQAKGGSSLETDLVSKIAAGVQNSDEGIIQSNEVEKQLMDLVEMEHPDTLSEGYDQEFLEYDERRTQNHALQQPRMPGKDNSRFVALELET